MLEIFERYKLPVGRWVEVAVDWLVLHGEPVFRTVRWPVQKLLDAILYVLGGLPWPVVVLLILAIGWRMAGRRIGVIAALGMVLVGFLGYWERAMETMGMTITAVVFCTVTGIPLGILSAHSDRLHRAMRLVLDAMQTIHPFVYIVPVVMFFGIGTVPGTLATMIFSLPPIVRLTDLGLRQVPPEVLEAARAFGASSMQLLVKVKLPLAGRTIMMGLNQTLMLALSMVVIVAVIAGGGLGQEIYRAVGRLDIGGAATSGLAVLILAIVLDRISQVQRSAGRHPHP